MIYYPINSQDGIKLSWDTPLNNQRSLDILGLLCSDNIVINLSSELISHYTYGYGSGTSSVGMDPYNFFTSKITNEMEYIPTELHEILLQNQNFLNLESPDFSQNSIIIHLSCITLVLTSSKMILWEYIMIVHILQQMVVLLEERILK